MSWVNDKRWSDRFIPEIKCILGTHLIGEPHEDEDRNHNTDLITLKMDAVRIACRIRRFTYWPRYSGDFTIRSTRPSPNAKTELSKLLSGWGDYLFYGYSDATEHRLHAWRLCDLAVFREWFQETLKSMGNDDFPGKFECNRDGSSTFRTYKWDQMRPDFVIAEGGMFSGGVLKCVRAG